MLSSNSTILSVAIWQCSNLISLRLYGMYRRKKGENIATDFELTSELRKTIDVMQRSWEMPSIKQSNLSAVIEHLSAKNDVKRSLSRWHALRTPWHCASLSGYSRSCKRF